MNLDLIIYNMMVSNNMMVTLGLCVVKKKIRWFWNSYIAFFLQTYLLSKLLSKTCFENIILSFSEAISFEAINLIYTFIFSDIFSKIANRDESESTNFAKNSICAYLSKFKHLWLVCDFCDGMNFHKFCKERMHICEYCDSYLKMSSSERIKLLLDPDTWNPMDQQMRSLDPIQFDQIDEWPRLQDVETFSSDLETLISDLETFIYTDTEEIAEFPVLRFLYSSRRSQSEYYASLMRARLRRTKLEEAKKKKKAKNNDLGGPSNDEPVVVDPEDDEPVVINPEDDEPVVINPEDDEPVVVDPEDEELEIFFFPEDDEIEINDDPYIEKMKWCQKETGLTEAVETGTGQLNGIPIAIGVMDFSFVGGSMGSVVGEKITRLIEYATNTNLPLILVCASGGARMQEGSLSLMQMAKISSALHEYQLNKKLFLISILTSPTTGGVTASFGMLGDIIIAEPDAYIAFAGKRVIEQTLNTIVPEGSQEAEFLFEKGLLDLIVPRNLLKSVLTELFHLHGFFPLNPKSTRLLSELTVN
uniref:acetyl-CoA carboxylase carboxyltransferase beta subunit n=1 Tax=Cratoxylum sumatranum TaxID=2516474 RepID=UPI0020016533|nr:acetyl-CoA carboxylase carboxyltransferase beta subunit [Cratoxylum sumatranum]YP_010361520.1 acetyl-CoA carboxylase carboxyltransferase beta subunit [Cratoxylum formosum]UNQ86749.1 acetyl-CoA carboxylase carboxyltransferase beta subunit [Cratoxylum sumatranum]UNQ87080.1 acetyl-CoA carboxylase carboxyltransferase beta subunit [Cratoxylum formosum]